jgi:hypothetical protein
VPIIRSWTGVDGDTSDGVCVLGASETHPGLFHAFGFNGHGFLLGPAVGAVLTELILDGKTRRLRQSVSRHRRQGERDESHVPRRKHDLGLRIGRPAARVIAPARDDAAVTTEAQPRIGAIGCGRAHEENAEHDGPSLPMPDHSTDCHTMRGRAPPRSISARASADVSP